MEPFLDVFSMDYSRRINLKQSCSWKITKKAMSHEAIGCWYLILISKVIFVYKMFIWFTVCNYKWDLRDIEIPIEFKTSQLLNKIEFTISKANNLKVGKVAQ